jgi:hypothetical protein
MSGFVPGTLVQMRTLRRFSHYLAGEVIAVPFDAARELDAKRLAAPMQLFVPTPVEKDDAAPTPVRQPGGIVKK